MSASGELHIQRPGLSIRARHAAMKHDRDRGDDRRDRGRQGRGSLDSRRSISPEARRPRHDDRDAGRDRGEPKFHGDYAQRPRERTGWRSSRRSRSRSGRHRDRSHRRYSDDRRDPRPDLSPRRSPRHPGYADDGDDAGAGSKRLRSRSPSPAGSYRKKSRRDHSDRHSDRRRHRSRDRHRSPRHRPRPGDRVRDSESAVDPYDRAVSETRSIAGDSRAADYPSRRTHRASPDNDAWSRESRIESNRSSPARHTSPHPASHQSQNRPPTSSSAGSRGRVERDFRPSDTERRHPSPGGRHRSGRDRSRERGFSREDPAASGANSIEVNMGSRGQSHAGYSSQHAGPFSHKTQHGLDSRANHSHSPTPNSSYHNSPTPQSPYHGRSGWNGQQQFSSSQQQYPPHSSHPPAPGPNSSTYSQPPAGPRDSFYSNSNRSPPHSAPTGPMSQQPGGYRGGFRGSSGSFRGNQFNPDRGGYRGSNFKSAQWTSSGPTHGSRSTPPDQPADSNQEMHPANSDERPSHEGRRNEDSHPFRPSRDFQANDSHSHQHESTSQQGQAAPASNASSATGPPDNTTSRPPPTGPSSSKFSFAFKTSNKQTPTAPKPEISQKFNAAPKQAPTQPRSQTQYAQKDRDHERERDRERGRDRGRDEGRDRDYERERERERERDRIRDRERDRERVRDRDRDRDLLRSAPTEPASARAARRHQEPPQPPQKQVRTRKVVKKMKRLIERPKLEPAMALSKSVFFRKPGNESVVGSGTYGKVFKGIHVYTNKSVALKRIRMEGERDGFPVTAMREVKLLQSLRHTNIVNLMEVMVEKNDCFMVFEYLAHDLTGILNHPTFKLNDAQRKHLSKQLFEGLDYLHGRGVLHRDIKAANILVSKEGILKFADFGLARFYAKRHQLDYTNRVVTIWYRSPELLLGETQYGPACDIWSAACVMMEIFARSAIFPGDGTEMNQLEKIYAVMGTPTVEGWPGILDMAWFELLRPAFKVRRTFEEKYEGQLSEAAFELLAWMFRYDPAKRPTAAEVLAHRYFVEEAPLPRQAVELADIDGDWHEFESKALRRENERKEKEARRAKEGQARENRERGGGKERERKRGLDEGEDRGAKRVQTNQGASEPS